jgi:O-antigen/teichoic acid export membrane protein
MLILARLLTPSDFGLVAMGMIAVGFIDVLVNLGVNLAVLRSKEIGPAQLNTGWTLRIIQSIVTAVFLVIVSPFVAGYFGAPQVKTILLVIAATALIGAFENIGPLLFQRNMQFGLEFRYLATIRFVRFVIGIVCAYVLQDYLALVLTTLLGRVFAVVWSYVAHDFRPKLSLEAAKDLLGVSQWLVLSNMGLYAADRIDHTIVGRSGGDHALGVYVFSTEISSIPSTELLAPISRVMFPIFLDKRGDPQRLADAVLLGMSVQALIAMPVGVGLALVARELVPLAFGEKWVDAIPLIQVLGLASIFTSVSAAFHYALLALNRVGRIGLGVWAQVTVAGAYLAAPIEDKAGGVPYLKLSMAGLSLLINVAFCMREMRQHLSVASIVLACWRPVAATFLMCCSVLAVGSLMAGQSELETLIAKVVAGAAAYAIAAFALWAVARFQTGGEDYLLSRLLPAAHSKISTWRRRDRSTNPYV